MWIFDLFRKQKKTLQTDNEIERIMTKIVTNECSKNDLYQKLLWNDIIVLTNGNNGLGVGNKIIEKDTTIEFLTIEDGLIPIFTSPNRIFDNKIVKKHMPYMAIKGQDLFNLAKEVSFVINPFSDYSIKLLPNDIENMMNGLISD